MSEPHLILGVGELLWDFLPRDGEPAAELDGASLLRLLGGAPANFAVMAGRLGNHAAILSRIGRDELGRMAIHQLDQADPAPADTAHIQVDPKHETGRVTVRFSDGEPHYTIHEPAAWDFLELSDEWVKLAERADAICYGSLGQRSAASRQTIQTLAAETPDSCIRIFDVNLRAPHYSGEVIQESLELATVIKTNATELPLVLNLLGLPADESRAGEGLRGSADRLLDEFPELDLVAITRGANGSMLVKRDQWHDHPGIPVAVADPIGAGDAFAAAMTHYLLRGASLATINEAGNRWGSWMAQQPGAMPALSNATLRQISGAIGQAV